MVKGKTSSAQNGWKLKKINQHIYQLCKEIEAFDDSIPWKSKYLIDGSDWTSPTSELTISDDTSAINQPFNFNPTIAIVSDSGNVDFRLQGFKRSKSVILSGSFNDWNEQAIEMRKDDRGWFTRLQLPSGIYEYKFIVDKKWMHDPANKLTVENEHKTWNSILLVGEQITFRLPSSSTAKSVV